MDSLEARNRQKEKEAKVKRGNEQRVEKESIKFNAEMYRGMINDTRYANYKLLLETLLKLKLDLRERLKDTAKTLDEYNLKGLVLDGQIEIIRNILDIPQAFIEFAQKGEVENERIES